MSRPGLLGVSLGGPMSGRTRYAKAMSLYQSGQISAAQLEAYRVAAASDHSPPDLVFAERDLPLPDLPIHRTANTPCLRALQHLLDEADRYLCTLAGPGIQEVRQGIARHRYGTMTHEPVGQSPVLDQHLPTALAGLYKTHPSLAAAITDAAIHLNWVTYGGFDPDQIGPDYGKSHAYASLLGEEAAIAAEDFDFGLFLIAPHVLYRDHNHAAPELYAPLTGPHGWRFGPDLPLIIKPAHNPIWNPAYQSHLIKAGPTPFLCFFGWTRDVQPMAKILPAKDWPALEALRLT
jgi:hypothetical protein